MEKSHITQFTSSVRLSTVKMYKVFNINSSLRAIVLLFGQIGLQKLPDELLLLFTNPLKFAKKKTKKTLLCFFFTNIKSQAKYFKQNSSVSAEVYTVKKKFL